MSTTIAQAAITVTDGNMEGVPAYLRWPIKIGAILLGFIALILGFIAFIGAIIDFSLYCLLGGATAM